MIKKYYILCVSIVLLVTLLVLTNICLFLYASFSFNAYPILPFSVCPNSIRGTNRLNCYSMEGIFDIYEYSDDCGTIRSEIERHSDLDSLCIYSVLQYAWKKDSLLLEVSLDNNSNIWLLASPASSKNYRCKLQIADMPSREYLSTYHNIKLVDNTFIGLLRKLDANWAFAICYSLVVLYGILHLFLIVLNVWVGVYAVKYRDLIMTEKVMLKKALYICAPALPIVTWIILRLVTYITLY